MTAISFEKHLPRLFLELLERHDDDQPFFQPLPGAVMLTDISGFSALARELTESGAHGAESLREILNDYFGSLGALVARHGGDISTFAGDSVIAVWPGRRDMAAAVRRAARCAMEIREQAGSWLPGHRVQLTQRIAVACGELTIAKLGGVNGKWLNVFAGPPVVEAGHACDVTPPGDVLLTARAAAALDGGALTVQRDDGYLRLEQLSGETEPAAERCPIPALDAGRLAAYVPDVLVRRAEWGQDEWLAEFRLVTVMFVKLENLNAEQMVTLQDIAAATQAVVQRYGGAMPYLQMDDKGFNFIIAFGIPTAAYEDDAARALRAGLEIQQALRQLGALPAIGVGTGILYCGECGADARRQYSLIGPAINFAARLASAVPDDLLCDEETAKAAKDALSFAIAHNVRPKHARSTVLAFRPEWRESAPTRAREGALVGRDAELERLLRAVDPANGSPGDRGPAVRLLLTGEPGIGKSRLLRELRARAEAGGVAVLAASARAMEVDTPYFIWRELLRALLERLAQPGETPAHSVTRLLADSTQLGQWAPLLNDVLPLGLAVTPLSEEMHGAPRASSIQALLMQLLETAGRRAPLLLMVDDLHWVDQLSANALIRVMERLPGLPVLVGSRALDAQASERSLAFARLPSLETLTLGALQESQTAEVLARLYGVEMVPTALSGLIHARAEGNPFYAEQLAMELRESGVVEIVGGRCKLRDDIAEYVGHSLPENLRGVIESRVDRLGGEAQLLLKVASVFGRVFTAEGLRAVYPIAPSSEDPGLLLDNLQDANLLVGEPGAGDDGYAFKHVMLQEAIYELLPLTQRKRLHRRIADWLENRYADALHGVFNVLANHCVQAEEFERAVDHLEGGAATAIRHSAYAEAIAGITSAQRIAAERELAPDPLRQARWHGLLGDAHHERSEYGEAKGHFLQVLELLGHPYAPSALSRLADVAARVVVRLAARSAPHAPDRAVDNTADPSADLPAGAADQHSLLSHAYQRLGEISYHENDPLAVLHLNLLSVAHGERAQAVPYMSAGYGGLAIAFGQAGLDKAARRHLGHSIALAEAAGSANDIAYAYLLAMVYASARCDWQILNSSGRRAEALYGDLGDEFRRASVYALWTEGALQRGDYARACELMALMAPYVGLNAPPRVAGWYLNIRLQLGIARGEVSRADIEERARISALVDSLVDQLTAFGTCASAWLRLGETERALAEAEQGLALLLGNVPVAGAGYIHGPLGVVEVLLATCEGPPRRDRARVIGQACAKLSLYTRQVPSTRPRGYFLLGCRAEIEGSRKRALRLWRRAAVAAEQLSMPYERAVALLAIGERLPPQNAALEEATTSFAALGVPTPSLFRLQRSA